jgi:hypothetical protein
MNLMNHVEVWYALTYSLEIAVDNSKGVGTGRIRTADRRIDYCTDL